MPAAKDDDASFFEMPHRPSTDERLGQLRDVDGRHHSRLYVDFLKRVLQHDRVHDRGQHADIVSGRTVHVTCAPGNAAKNIATANYDRYLHAHFMNGLELFSDHAGDIDVDAVILLAHQGFAGNLQENALIGERGFIGIRFGGTHAFFCLVDGSSR